MEAEFPDDWETCFNPTHNGSRSSSSSAVDPFLVSQFIRRAEQILGFIQLPQLGAVTGKVVAALVIQPFKAVVRLPEDDQIQNTNRAENE